MLWSHIITEADIPVQVEVWCKDEALAVMLHGAEGTVEKKQLHPTALDQVHLVTQRQVCVACNIARNNIIDQNDSNCKRCLQRCTRRISMNELSI